MPPDELLQDAVRLGHVKYLFVAVLEGCLDAAHHVAAAEGWRPPDTNAEAMLLGRHGVLEPELVTTMAQAVRFRNVTARAEGCGQPARLSATFRTKAHDHGSDES